MATSRICTDTVTLFNYLGQDENRRAVYQATVLSSVHAAAAEGQIKTASVAEDTLKVLIFDDRLVVSPQREFVPYRAWNSMTADERNGRWTLSPDGKDYLSLGVHETDEVGHLPENITLYGIQKVTRHAKGSLRMQYWTVEAT